MDLLRPEVRTEMDRQLFAAACEGFAREPTPEFELDVAEHVRDGNLYVVGGEDRILGFAVMKDFPNLEATYISGIVKGSGTPSGIIERIVALHAQNFRVVTVRTQNDRVVEIMKNICSVVVPLHREAGERELGILEAMGLLTGNAGVDMVARGHYGGNPMIGAGERRRSGDGTVKKTTDRLNYENGDALLVVGYRPYNAKGVRV